jgi:hypothetical protein
MILEGDGAPVLSISIEIYFLGRRDFVTHLQILRRTVAQLSSYKFLQPFRISELNNSFLQLQHNRPVRREIPIYTPCTLFFYRDEQI